MNGYHSTMSVIERDQLEQERKIDRALDIAKNFTANASQSGGRLDLEIDRYGHIKMTFVINKGE